MCASVSTKRITNSLLYRLPNDVVILRRGVVSERGTQQEYSYVRHAVRNRIPVAPTLGKVNVSLRGMFDQRLKLNKIRSTAKHFLRRK
jgi:hypothetical protein